MRFVSAILLVMALILSLYLLSIFIFRYDVDDTRIVRTQEAILRFLAAATAFFVAAYIGKRIGLSGFLAARPRAGNIALGIVSLWLFLFIVNNFLSMKYHAGPEEGTKTVFMKDERLGWRMRPGTDEKWDGVRYQVSSKGLRSPYGGYEKPEGTVRILQLGDSVTVGYRLPYEGTTACLLEELFRKGASARKVEVINAGCDGYSPWQEYELLRTEGMKYEPDLVTVGFVPNDVTEQFGLKKFGGRGIGFQLSHTKDYGDVSVLSSLRYSISRMPFYLFLEERLLKLRFGKDVKEGAKKLEELQVEDLVYRHGSPEVLRAWEKTLSDLKKITDHCSENGVEVLILIFPYTFQLDLPPQEAYPQSVLKDFCERNGVRYIDLLPLFSDEMKRSGRDATYYFIDFDHPTVEGNKFIALTLYNYLAQHNILKNQE